MRTMPASLQRPPRLFSGARVALIAPAGPINDERLAQATAMCARLELDPVIGASALSRTGYLAGSDESRAADLQRAIDDPDIHAIWALRGGYGTMRLLSRLRFDALRSSPKAFIGFSDNTSIHLALARAGFVSFHGPHAGGDFPEFAEQCFRAVLYDSSRPAQLVAPAGSALEVWHEGTAEGRLIGGNLALLSASEGTPYAMPADGAILFIEDIAEPPYRVDRLLMQLVLSGALDRVAAVVVGQFTDCDDATASSLDIVRDQLLPLGVPIIANAPIGHVENNWTLPVGIRARVHADRGVAELIMQEPAVTES
jgi:muramoyltetrapeptide carboxypeptidase